MEDWRLHNTKLLLKHYRDLKDRCDSGVYDSRMLDQRTNFEKIEDLMQGRDGDIILDSTYRSIIRTRTLVADVDAMMEAFRRDVANGDEVSQRRYQVIYFAFICNPRMTTRQLSEKFGVSGRTIQTDIKESIEQLSAKYFGSDGIHFLGSDTQISNIKK